MKKLMPLLICLALMVSCSLPFGLSNIIAKVRGEKTPTPGLMLSNPLDPSITQSDLLPGDGSDIAHLISTGQIEFITAEGSETGFGFVGPVIDVTIQNTTQDTISIVIPSGLILIPDNDDVQQMMVIQSIELDLDAGETEIISPFVVCIESDNAAPSPDDGFTIGSMAEGKLAQLAACFDKERIEDNGDIQDLFSVQFATWMVADDMDFTSIPEDSGGALGEILGGQVNIPGLGDFMQTFLSTMAPDAQTWLDKCGLSVGN